MFRPDGGASRLTWRLLHDLIVGLPGESLTKTAMRDGLSEEELAALASQPHKGHGPWSRVDLRLAAIEDAQRQQTAVMIWLAGNRKGDPKMPEPVTRPGVTGRRRGRQLSAADKEYLAHLRANRGALPDGMQFIAAS